MIIIPPPLRKRPSRAKSHRLSGLGPVPPPPPVTTVTVATDAPSYPIDPAITVTVTITDTAPSASGYTVQISYDSGANWQTVGTNQPLNENYFNPAVQFPEVTPSDHCVFRATNNDTAAYAVSNEFALTAE